MKVVMGVRMKQARVLFILTLSLILKLMIYKDGQFQYLDTSDDGQDDEPEPEKDVDFLVDDVEGEDAEAVELLHRSGRTKLVECALGHLGEVNFYV